MSALQLVLPSALQLPGLVRALAAGYCPSDSAGPDATLATLTDASTDPASFLATLADQDALAAASPAAEGAWRQTQLSPPPLPA